MMNEQKLRKFIQKTLNERNDDIASRKAMGMVKDVLKLAETYVESVVADTTSSKHSDPLTDAIKKLQDFAVLSQRGGKSWANSLVELSVIAGKLGKKSGFWARPKFLNKLQYIEEVREALKEIKASARTVWQVLNQ